MKKFLAFLFVGLLFLVAAQTVTANVKTDLKPGIEFVQGQVETPVYEVVIASPAAFFVQDSSTAIVPAATATEALYSDCLKTLPTPSHTDQVFSPGTRQDGFLQGSNKADTELFISCNKRLPPGSLSHERSFKNKRVARQRAILSRKYPG